MLLRSYSEEFIEAGCDEAGRGCLAGPVFAAAVILPPYFKDPGLNDSKQLSAKQRARFRILIEQKATCWAVASVSHRQIDRLNILRASLLAMHRALAKLKVAPGLILVDGNRFRRFRNVPHVCIVQGDALYASIAAAGILAKTYRDEHMERIHNEYPRYNWKENKGYPTEEHRNIIRAFGCSKYHRLSFRLLPDSPELPFPH